MYNHRPHSRAFLRILDHVSIRYYFKVDLERFSEMQLPTRKLIQSRVQERQLRYNYFGLLCAVTMRLRERDRAPIAFDPENVGVLRDDRYLIFQSKSINRDSWFMCARHFPRISRNSQR